MIKRTTCIHSRFLGLKKDLKNNISKFRIPSKFADKLTVKARGEKAWILYEFPFSLTLICMKYFCNVTA